ncbi:O-antigen ligase family protein [Pseudomonadota bacterium]
MSAVMTESDAVPKLTIFKERFVYGLVFLFPIAGVSVRHWFSAIFAFLFFISLWDLVRTRIKGERRLPTLFREEKIWLWLCASFFLVSMASALINGWGHAQNRALGVDIRYLFIVPLFLMLRQYPQVWRVFLAGVALAAVVLAGQAYCDIYSIGLQRAQGVYSPNLMGPVAALVAVWLLCGWRLLGRARWLIPVLVVAALYAVVMTGSRGAYLAVFFMALVWALLHVKNYWKVIAVALVFVIPTMTYNYVPSVKQRVDVVVTEVDRYFIELEKGNHLADGAANVRFEMWRAGWLVFQQAPLIGIGRGNYTEAVMPFVKNGELPVQVSHHGHAHNAYLDVLMSRGAIGFFVFLGLLFYPLYVFLSTYKIAPESALLGTVQIVGFAVFSLTDASTFIKGNYVSVFLLCLTVLFSWHIRKIKEVE